MIENLLCNYIPFFLCNISQESLEKAKLAELLYSLHEKGKGKLSIEQPRNSSCLRAAACPVLHAPPRPMGTFSRALPSVSTVPFS